MEILDCLFRSRRSLSALCATISSNNAITPSARALLDCRQTPSEMSSRIQAFPSSSYAYTEYDCSKRSACVDPSWLEYTNASQVSCSSHDSSHSRLGKSVQTSGQASLCSPRSPQGSPCGPQSPRSHKKTSQIEPRSAVLCSGVGSRGLCGPSMHAENPPPPETGRGTSASQQQRSKTDGLRSSCSRVTSVRREGDFASASSKSSCRRAPTQQVEPSGLRAETAEEKHFGERPAKESTRSRRPVEYEELVMGRIRESCTARSNPAAGQSASRGPPSSRRPSSPSGPLSLSCAAGCSPKSKAASTQQKECFCSSCEAHACKKKPHCASIAPAESSSSCSRRDTHSEAPRIGLASAPQGGESSLRASTQRQSQRAVTKQSQRDETLQDNSASKQLRSSMAPGSQRPSATNALSSSASRLQPTQQGAAAVGAGQLLGDPMGLPQVRKKGEAGGECNRPHCESGRCHGIVCNCWLFVL